MVETLRTKDERLRTKQMNQPNTINELFNFAVEQFRDDELVRFKKGNEWQSLSYGEIARRVRELALGLYAEGFRREDKIAIWSENRPEWNVADLAVLAIGAVDVPIYTTQSRQHLEYILKDSNTAAIFVSTAFLDDANRVFMKASGAPQSPRTLSP
jgi:long-chain acyl-CoA synthetase